MTNQHYWCCRWIRKIKEDYDVDDSKNDDDNNEYDDDYDDYDNDDNISYQACPPSVKSEMSSVVVDVDDSKNDDDDDYDYDDDDDYDNYDDDDDDYDDDDNDENISFQACPSLCQVWDAICCSC